MIEKWTRHRSAIIIISFQILVLTANHFIIINWKVLKKHAKKSMKAEISWNKFACIQIQSANLVGCQL